MITNFSRVSNGDSGGVTLIGTVGGIAGAILLALVGTLIFEENSVSDYQKSGLFIVISGGLFGNLMDSLTGALIQSKYTCNVCGTVTEYHIHCDEPTTLFSGIRLIDNEVVNSICAVSGGIFSYIVWVWIK